jgi:hypothetical protein
MKWGSKRVSFCWNIEFNCYAYLSEEGTVSFKISDSNSCNGILLTVHSVYSCWIGPETRNGAQKGSVVAEKTEIYCAHALYRRGETRSKTQSVIMLRNVFGRPQCLCMLNRSGNTKRCTKRVGGCGENWDLLCLCTVQEKWDPLENANFDSLGRMFSALACFYACWIGPETRNGARKGSVVAKIFEKHYGLMHCEER